MVATIAHMSSMYTYIPHEYYEIPTNEPDIDGITPDTGGLWWNPGKLFGGVGSDLVDRFQFHHLSLANDPNGGEELNHAEYDDPERPGGLDITFTADKTISVLWALAEADIRLQIECALHDAVLNALEDPIVSYCSFASLVVPGKVSVLVPGTLIGALFPRGNDVWGNPHLHTRCVLFNCVRCHDVDQYEESERQDLRRWAQAVEEYRIGDPISPSQMQLGLWGNLAEDAINKWTKAAGAVFRACLASNLQTRLGLTMEQYGRDRAFTRIAGIPQRLVDLWSGPSPARDAENTPDGEPTPTL